MVNGWSFNTCTHKQTQSNAIGLDKWFVYKINNLLCVDDSVDIHTHTYYSRIARATFKVNARHIHTEMNALALIDLNTRIHPSKEKERIGGGWWAWEHTASHRNELNFSTIYITAHILLVKCKLWFLLFMFMKSKHQTKNAHTHTLL